MKPGTKVRVKGLVKAAKHNGKIGIVTKASAPGEGRRVGVKLRDGSGVLAVKIENLETLRNSPSSSASSASKSTSTSKLPSTSTATSTATTTATATTTTTTPTPLVPKERTLKRDNALLRELDGSPDPNVLVLYYHFADRAFDCFNATEYNVQMLRYYEKGLAVKLIAPRMVGTNEYFLVGLQQHAQTQHDQNNSLCEVAFQCRRSFEGISMLVKKGVLPVTDRCPGRPRAKGVGASVSARMIRPASIGIRRSDPTTKLCAKGSIWQG
eukprot:CAMPEP_0172391624 /NCGR_PEP_ID=MMETSP1061-20121228/7981_1 /TAXON_ID=37318 /ORGANISM="Pseudo-nitzschia pungens, Strain cf. pungens" /LENGTH=267 /DNA_ID=CAMNT_0013122293 /DNA_START=21 /DNA_END=825 /DNA_ORIENTATION=+